jgi:hypothetical protein
MSILEDATQLRAPERILIEVVPEEQRDLAFTERLLLVVAAVFDSTGRYLEPSGVPHVLKIDDQTKLVDVKPLIQARFDITAEKIGKVKFFKGTSWTWYQPKSCLQDDASLWFFSARELLYALIDARKTGSGREEALRIDN